MLTATEAAVLGLLADGEQSGYDLRRCAERSVGYFWAPARSQIYAVLPRLVEAGLARRRHVRQDTRPDKRLYRITAAGRARAGPQPPPAQALLRRPRRSRRNARARARPAA